MTRRVPDDPSVVNFLVVIQGDDGDQLWEVDSELCARLGQARANAKDLLRFARRMVTRPYPSDRYPVMTAFIYAGRMVNIGEDEDPDWVFQADPAIDAEVVR